MFSPRDAMSARVLLVLAMAFALGGCDQLGLETPAKAAERKLAEARAIGSACRHAMRAIEDCYVLNPKADKSAVIHQVVHTVQVVAQVKPMSLQHCKHTSNAIGNP